MSSITYYRPERDGSVETKDMAESVRDYHVRDAQRTYPQWHVMHGVTVHRVDTATRDGAMLRVDWLATDDGNAYVWFVEEGDAPTLQSGYTHCACRDCMDVAITSDGKPVLCLLCKDAGCYMWPGEWGGVPLHGPRDAHGYECQREDAYESGEDE